MAPRETENNAYAKFWGDTQRELWNVTVFSGVVNPMWLFPFFIFPKTPLQLAVCL